MCSGSIGQLKPAVFTPVNTLCHWNLECDTKFSMNIELNLSNVEQVSIRQTSDGFVTELQRSAATRRSLNTGNLLSTNFVYSVTNADSVEIVYRNNEDHYSTGWIVIADRHSSGKDSSSIILIVTLTILLPVLLVATIILLYWWYKKSRRSHNVGPINNQIQIPVPDYDSYGRNDRRLPPLQGLL